MQSSRTSALAGGQLLSNPIHGAGCDESNPEVATVAAQFGRPVSASDSSGSTWEHEEPEKSCCRRRLRGEVASQPLGGMARSRSGSAAIQQPGAIKFTATTGTSVGRREVHAGRAGHTPLRFNGEQRRPIAVFGSCYPALAWKAWRSNGDKLRHQIKELETVRDIMRNGSATQVMQLLIRWSNRELWFLNDYLKEYLSLKVEYIKCSPAAFLIPDVVVSSREASVESPTITSPGIEWMQRQREMEQDMADAATTPERLHEIQERYAAVDRLIDIYCRSSSEAIIEMGDELTRQQQLLSTKYDLNLKLICAVFGALFLACHWYFEWRYEDDFKEQINHMNLTALANSLRRAAAG